MYVIKRDGRKEELDVTKIHKATKFATEGLENVSQTELEKEAKILFFDGIQTQDIQRSLMKSAATLISTETPNYTYVAARLLLQLLYKEVTDGEVKYPSLRSYIERGVQMGMLDPRLMDFDLDYLDQYIKPDRDLDFTYLGLQTLADRYFIREYHDSSKVEEGKVMELPQHFWMRVAMGIALAEKPEVRTKFASAFYDVLSKKLFVSSTPTLFNSGTVHPQLSSCYLNTVEDSIEGIYGTITECAHLSKYSGGLGTDWTRVRSAGDLIKGTNGRSSGVVPYLKVFNDTAVAVNQGGKRNGAFAAYLEPWHADVREFIKLRKNSGDERRRTHDIHPVLWIPDLFMERVENDQEWSLFSPNDFPDLHELHGEAFRLKYEEAERSGKAREVLLAKELWREILTSLYETGHPWVTFKDECNRRNPQDHWGVIHSSNLCTEIALVTSDQETAVCNLGSLNLARLNEFSSKYKIEDIVALAVRMLDNVIDVNFYPSDRSRRSNMVHRPIGLGVMGYTEWLVQRGIDWESKEHLKEAEKLFEKISYYAISASCKLAKERSPYTSYHGSKWERGILPIDTARDVTGYSCRMDWDWLRRQIAEHGMRNSNVMAIAPTATISNIAGTTPCIEPIYKREYEKSNLSGYFTVVDPCMQYNRPHLCKEAFEVKPKWILKAAAVRQRYIDQAQSTNIFVPADIKGRDLSDIYMKAWKLGLKTTYYLRNQTEEIEQKVCSITDPSCESCQ